jgi:hypothetical protein
MGYFEDRAAARKKREEEEAAAEKARAETGFFAERAAAAEGLTHEEQMAQSQQARLDRRAAEEEDKATREEDKTDNLATVRQVTDGQSAIRAAEPTSSKVNATQYLNNDPNTQMLNPEQLLEQEKTDRLNRALLYTLGGTALIGAGIIAAPFLTGAGAVTATARAAQVGRAAKTVSTASRGGTLMGTAEYFATNAKTLATTTSWIKKLGGAPTIVGIIGSYPFAGFIKEEALQTLGMATRTSLDSGNYAAAQKSVDEVNETLNPKVWEKIIAGVPFANVVKQLQNFYKAAKTKNKADQEAIDKAIAVAEGEAESKFAMERRLSDEAARERELENRGEDEQYYQGIKEQNAKEDEKKREAEAEYYSDIEERNRQKDLEKKQFDALYYKLIREKKFDEAEALLASQ